MVNATRPVPDRTKRLPRCNWNPGSRRDPPFSLVAISWLHVSLWGLQLAISLPELKFLQDKKGVRRLGWRASLPPPGTRGRENSAAQALPALLPPALASVPLQQVPGHPVGTWAGAPPAPPSWQTQLCLGVACKQPEPGNSGAQRGRVATSPAREPRTRMHWAEPGP